MSFLKTIWAAFVQSHLLLASGATALYFYIALALGATTPKLGLLIFCSVQMIYILHALSSLSSQNVDLWKRKKFYIGILIFDALGIALSLFSTSVMTGLMAMVLILSVLPYGHKLKFIGFSREVRAWPYCKAPLSTAAIVLIIVGLPMVSGELLFIKNNSWVLLLLITHIMINVNLGDCRDLTEDRARGVKTWVGLLGYRISMKVMGCLSFILLMMSVVFFNNGVVLPLLITLGVTGLICLSLKREIKPEQYALLDLLHFLPLTLWGILPK